MSELTLVFQSRQSGNTVKKRDHNVERLVVKNIRMKTTREK